MPSLNSYLRQKTFFVYKLFLSLNILDFSLHIMQKLQPPSSKIVKVSLFENLVGGLTSPLAERRRDAHYEHKRWVTFCVTTKMMINFWKFFPCFVVLWLFFWEYIFFLKIFLIGWTPWNMYVVFKWHQNVFLGSEIILDQFVQQNLVPHFLKNEKMFDKI